jgi:arginine deiminase
MSTLHASCQSESDALRMVLLCEPGAELLYALVLPEAANFEKAFDSREAINEHRNYQQFLRRKGIAVYLLEDLLAAHPQLIDHATQAVSIPGTTFPVSDLRKNVSNLGISDQIRLLVESPEMNLSRPPNPQLASVTINPLPNLYFMRDQIIVTDRGVIVGRFKNAIRQEEQRIVRLALDALGINVKYTITGNGVLEGGDFIPAGDWGLIGVGERTNEYAIDQLLQSPGADALGYKHLAIIKDPVPDIQEMHLDTYFMLVAPDTCLVVDTRVKPPMQGAPDRRPTVDIYDKDPGGGEDYVLQTSGISFLSLLKQMGITSIVQLTEMDQREYGINVLCLESKNIVGSKSDEQDPVQLRSYQQKLATALLRYNLLRFTNIRKGFGSNHCMSQVFLRG